MASEVEFPEEHLGHLNEIREGAKLIEEFLFVKIIGEGLDVGNGEGEVAGGGEEAHSQRVFTGKVFVFEKKKSWIPSSKDASLSIIRFYGFPSREVTRKERGELLGGESVKFCFLEIRDGRSRRYRE